MKFDCVQGAEFGGFHPVPRLNGSLLRPLVPSQIVAHLPYLRLIKLIQRQGRRHSALVDLSKPCVTNWQSQKFTLEFDAMNGNSNSWRFSLTELEKSPSILSGARTLITETNERTKGTHFMSISGMSLKLSRSTISTSMVYFHRFYQRESLAKHNYYEVGATCLLIASKLAQSKSEQRSLRSLINTCAQKAAKNDVKLSPESREYARWSSIILYYEQFILATLCFDLDVELPYESLCIMHAETGGLISAYFSIEKTTANGMVFCE